GPGPECAPHGARRRRGRAARGGAGGLARRPEKDAADRLAGDTVDRAVRLRGPWGPGGRRRDHRPVGAASRRGRSRVAPDWRAGHRAQPRGRAADGGSAGRTARVAVADGARIGEAEWRARAAREETTVIGVPWGPCRDVAMAFAPGRPRRGRLAGALALAWAL